MAGALTDESFWDDRWADYSRPDIIGSGHPFFGRNGSFLRVLEHEAGVQRGSVLELGGAASYYLLTLAKWRGLETTALDFSAVGLQQTKDIFAVNGCTVEAVQNDLFTWQPAIKYDLVMHLGLMEHFEHPEDIMRVCAGLLAPGGKVFFTMPNMVALGAKLWRRWSPNDWSKHIYHSDNAVTAACRAAGLRIERSFHWGPPMLQAAPWEHGGPLPKLIGLAQRGTYLCNRIVPYCHRGTSWLSAHRGFVATQEL